MNELRLAEVISSGLMYEWPLHARRVKCGACGTQMADLHAHLDGTVVHFSLWLQAGKNVSHNFFSLKLLPLAIAPAPSQHL